MPRSASLRTNVTIEQGERGDRRFFNPWRIFCEMLPHMIDEAQDARLEALNLSKATTRRPPNYRDFYVGSSLITVEPDNRALDVQSAHNTMPTKQSKNVCAEKRVKDRSDKIARSAHGVLWGVGLVVVGEPQADRATGNTPETLWPCGEVCWPNIVKKLPSDCLVLTVRPDKRKAQLQTAAELDAFYGAVIEGGSPSEPPLFSHNEQSWSSAVERFDAIFLRDIDPLASLENRDRAVEAARVAIQGIRFKIV